MRKNLLSILFLFALSCLPVFYATAQCTTPSIITIERFLPAGSYNVAYTYQQTGTYYFEYGPVGFTPGTTASPGVGGTVVTLSSAYGVSQVNLPWAVSNIVCYIRLHCNNTSWTANSAPFNYTTGSTTQTPQIFPLFGLNTPTYQELNNPMFGSGVYNYLCNFWGNYGEARLRFDCPDTSYYEVTILTPDPYAHPDLLQKPLSSSAANYLCEPYDAITSIGFYTKTTYYIGPFNKGTVYDLLLDANNSSEHLVTVEIKCPRPENISKSNISSTSVTFNWSCFCPDSVILEYGPTGFTPGTGAVAGINGNLIAPVSSPYTLNGLTPFTAYDVYFRSACGGNYSLNKLIKIKTAKDCNTFPVLSCNSFGQFNYAGSTASRGAWDLSGCVSIDSSEEAVYKFTPAVTGNYQLTVYNLTSGWTGYLYPARFYYKAATSCNEIGWTCIGSSQYSPPGFVTHAYAFGPLTAGTMYYIAVDGNTFTSYHSYTYHFQLQCLSCMSPAQPAAITGPNTFCSGSVTPLTYSVPAVAGATGYTWTKPGGWTGTSTTNSITLTPGSNGYISCAVSNSCGQGPPKSFWVYATTTPTQPSTMSGNTLVCQGSSQTYSVPAVSGATSYLWTLPAGWSGTSTTTSITVTPGASGGTVSVQAVNACFTGIARTKAVTVTPVPAQPNPIIGNSSVCTGTSYTYSVDSVPGATSYQWTLPLGWSGTSSTRFITVISGTAGGTLSVTATNSCGTGAARTLTVSIATAPAKPGTITAAGGNTKVCPGDVKNYSIAAVSGATSYNWTPPPGGTITNGQGTTAITITYNSGFVATDTLEVTASNGCATSLVRWIKITRNNPAIPGTISGSAYGICGINNLTYSVTNVTGITYAWSSGSGTAVVQSGQGTNSVVFNFLPGFSVDTIKVAAGNNCGSSAFRKLTVRKIPAQPGLITGTNVPCSAQQNVPYSISPVFSATTYTWIGPTGSHIYDGTVLSPLNTLVTTATNVTVNFGTTAGYVKVRANSPCGSGSYRSMAVTFPCRIGHQEMDSSPFTLLPNPATDQVILNFDSHMPDRYSMFITDISGKRVLERNGNATQGSNELVVEVDQLASGSYFVHLECGSWRQLARLQIE